MPLQSCSPECTHCSTNAADSHRHAFATVSVVQANGFQNSSLEAWSAHDLAGFEDIPDHLVASYSEGAFASCREVQSRGLCAHAVAAEVCRASCAGSESKAAVHTVTSLKAEGCHANMGLNQGCNVCHECGAGLSCQPFKQKCYHKPRQTGEPCVTLAYPCGEGLTCQLNTFTCESSSADTVTNDISHVADDVSNGIDTVFDLLKNAGKDLSNIEHFADCLTSKGTWLDIQNNLKTLFTSADGAKSLSSDLMTKVVSPLWKDIWTEADSLIYVITNISMMLQATIGNQSLVTNSSGQSAAANIEKMVPKLAQTVLENTDQILQAVGALPGMELFECANTYILDPVMASINSDVQQLTEDVLQLFITFWKEFSGTSWVEKVAKWVMSAAQDVINDVMKISKSLDKIDAALASGLNTGCQDAMHFIAGDTTIKPLGLECGKNLSLLEQPLQMALPMFEAGLVGLVEVGLHWLRLLFYEPLVNQAVTAIHQALGSALPQIVDGLCGLIPEAGGPICMAVTTSITTGLFAIIPALVADLLNLPWQLMTDLFTEWIPKAANTLANTWASSSTFGGKQVAHWFEGAELKIDGFLAPVSEVLIPIFDDILSLAMPKVDTSLKSCVSTYNNVYALLQHRFCDGTDANVPQPAAAPSTPTPAPSTPCPSQCSSVSDEWSGSCAKWAVNDEWGALENKNTLADSCASTWGKSNCASTCCCAGYTAAAAAPAPSTPTPAPSTPCPTAPALSPAPSTSAPAPSGASNPCVGQCSDESDTWETSFGATPSDRCFRWAVNSTWGALSDSNTLATSCASSWAKSYCAATCCCAGHCTAAGLKDTWVYGSSSTSASCGMWATLGWGAHQDGTTTLAQACSPQHEPHHWGYTNCAKTCCVAGHYAS